MKKTETEINYCVIIPTYNNEKTLATVIDDTLKITPHVIVVNDGSDDSTFKILKAYKEKTEIISFEKNRGKGAALKAGFKKAEELGYEYAIAIDSDGQHFASDIPNFLEKVIPGQPIFIIGNRDMTAEGIPQKSIFGRKFSNFWVKLQTGLTAKDSQSGFRLYTVKQINSFFYFTSRYNFEIEALVRWGWRELPFTTVDIKVYYPPAEDRVSHFKGFLDNFRISILNTYLTIMSLAIIYPFRLLKWIIRSIASLFRPKKGS